MAYTAGNLHLRPGAVGDMSYYYDAGSDSMATVIASGYFNNTDDDLNLAAEDTIWCQCSDGNMRVRVSAVSSGTVTTQYAGGDLPNNGDKGATVQTLLIGYSEVGTGTGTAFTLPTVYVGARVGVFKSGSATTGQTFTTNATTVTVNEKGDTVITIDAEGDNFELTGVSTTQWRIVSGTGMVFS